VKLSPALDAEYTSLFASASIRPERAAQTRAVADKIIAGRARYEAVGFIPWYLVGAFHLMEAAGRFDRHLHNGDPLTARTVRVPAGRPANGSPPFAWEESARDVIGAKMIYLWDDAIEQTELTAGDIGRTLYVSEAWNGFGYRGKSVRSPYLWGGTNHSQSGKYIADGVWDAKAVTGQIGVAAILLELRARGIVSLDALARRAGPAVHADASEFVIQAAQGFVNQLVALNAVAGPSLTVDGRWGPKTAAKWREVAG
jgi:lysozyme family protein